MAGTGTRLTLGLAGTGTGLSVGPAGTGVDGHWNGDELGQGDTGMGMWDGVDTGTRRHWDGDEL